MKLRPLMNELSRQHSSQHPSGSVIYLRVPGSAFPLQLARQLDVILLSRILLVLIRVSAMLPGKVAMSPCRQCQNICSGHDGSLIATKVVAMVVFFQCWSRVWPLECFHIINVLGVQQLPVRRALANSPPNKVTCYASLVPH